MARARRATLPAFINIKTNKTFLGRIGLAGVWCHARRAHVNARALGRIGLAPALYQIPRATDGYLIANIGLDIIRSRALLRVGAKGYTFAVSILFRNKITKLGVSILFCIIRVSYLSCRSYLFINTMRISADRTHSLKHLVKTVPITVVSAIGACAVGHVNTLIVPSFWDMATYTLQIHDVQRQ